MVADIMKLHLCYFTLSFFLINAAATALSLETYGDSVTIGFNAGTFIPTDFDDAKRERRELIFYALFKRVPLLKHKAWQNFEEQHAPELAWPARVAERFAERGERVQLLNRAVSGARVFNLASQIVGPQNFQEKVLAFFFIGNNDLCEDKKQPPYHPQTFFNTYDQTLAIWDRAHVNATAYLIPMGDIPRIYRTLERQPWSEKRTGKILTCTHVWRKFLPECKYYTRLHEYGTLDQTITPLRNQLNSLLPILADRRNQMSRRGNRYIYLAGTLDAPYTADDFAMDCFHLSAIGQDKLGDLIFSRI
jgi:lysophospholipase L1-like esterase